MKFVFVFSLLFSFFAEAELLTKTLVYGNGKFEGFLAMPKELRRNTPAILMVHNWMGISDETKLQAKRFADIGYIVFALDIYGKGKAPKNAQEAGQIAGKYKTDRKLFRENLNTGLQFLLQQKNVDAEKIAVAGYCFGGTGAIELARSGADVKAIISFHGGLDSLAPADGKNIKGQLLVHHGEIDPYVPAKDIEAFEKELKDNNVKYELIKYPDAVHSFTDKTSGNDVSKGAAYNEVADKKSFEKTRVFLNNVFKTLQ